MRQAGQLLGALCVVVVLALVSGCSGNGGDGTGLTGPSVGTAASPPNPNKIVYERKVQQGKGWYYSRLFTVNPDGTGVTEVAGNGSGDPAWSPDGTKIVYSCSNRLYTMGADGSGKTPITSKNVDVDPAWSPNGTTIAFARNSGRYSIGLYTVPATGGTAKLVPGTVPGDQLACWSPNGDFLLFEGSQRKDANGDEAIGLYTIPSAGGTATRLIDTFEGTTYGYNYHSDSDWTATPTDRILYGINTTVDGKPSFYIFCQGVAVSGGSVTTVGDPFVVGVGEHPTWSPTGLQAAMSALAGYGVLRRDVPLTPPPSIPGPFWVTPLPGSADQGMDPDWSP